MAPGQKRKPIEDDFIHTISDNEDGPVEEEKVLAERPKKKAKTAQGKTTKKEKQDDVVEEEGEPEGIWGQKEDDDGAMDSDFEFSADNAADFGAEEFEGWGFDGAKKGMNADKKGVDLDEIIRRRREKKNGTDAEANEEEVEAEMENDMDVDLDDSDDEVLADDAFGMNVDSDAEESGDEKQDGEDGEEEDDEAASDNDSVATPVEHPDDDEDDDASGGSEDDEDAEEEAKRQAFFAPEEKVKPGKKTDVSSFQAMSLSRPILRGLANVGFTKPTPIQSKSIPIALMGKDLVGGAVTGSGKTGAFIVPILERLLYRPKKVPTTRVVILTPTRELAIQCHAVGTKLAAHTDIKFTLAVGGLSLKMQEAELRLRPDVIIATPGRFIDHMRNSASFNVDTVEILVLDEADRMLEDGFADELNEILTTLPKSRQTMLFSATMTSTVDRLIRVGLNKPARVMVDAQKKTVTTLVQEFVRLRPGREEKRMGYLAHVCQNLYRERVIIFFRQKKEAHRARIIFGLLGLTCAELHGSMNQTQRITSVEDFRDGKVSYLLATDLASRGLDIKGVDTVINYEAPQSLEIYVHRVGRTARAGRKGIALTLAAEPDRKVVKAAVKAGKAQGAKILSRVIDGAEVDKLQAQIDEMEDEIEDIMKEEKEERHLAHIEMQVKKGENLIAHEAEIKSRPKRTWFETEHDKKQARQSGKDELNGMRDTMKQKTGKLSNKDKKRLDAKQMRSEGGEWRKGKTSEADNKARAKEAKQAKAKKTKAKAGQEPKKVPHKGKPRAKMGGKRNGTPQGPPKLAPFRGFGFGRPHPHPRHQQSLFRYLFPRAVRDRYRERLLGFHLETLPTLKHSFQSRIYRYILERQARRTEKRRVVDAVVRQGRRLLLGPPRARPAKDGKGRLKGSVARRMPAYEGTSAGYGSDRPPAPDDRDRGYRRRKLATMAGNLYRSGQQAVSELKESYAQTRAGGDAGYDGNSRIHIPGAFPDVAIAVQGNDQMVLFPSYAKRHTKNDWVTMKEQMSQEGQPGTGDEDFWRQEWERMEDEKAIVDVDVRGWLYSPHSGPMTRRNRILIGLARQLSGIPAPRANQGYNASGQSLQPPLQTPEEAREQEKISQEAARIEQQGQEEKRVAYQGGYSEKIQDGYDIETEGMHPFKNRSGRGSPNSPPASPHVPPRTNTTSSNDLSEAELSMANANLMARIAPFMTNPMVALPITLFFYNDTKSQSKTIMTNDAGHFIARAALEFVPTHVRVLANESLSAIQEIEIIEPHGVSLISDIDDTIKRSNISGGAKEIFRNTFVRDLADLTIEGVKEWYNRMHDLGVQIHYCSNSPWQLFPVLASFFKLGGLPPGSLHLKQYSGMLQGIFEPVAERKKSTLTRLLMDFPSRQFMLVGDSGEADLEVYTELALANPGRILAVFIRDVTSPEETKFFDPGFDPIRRKISNLSLNGGKNTAAARPAVPRQNSSPGEGKAPSGPAMGNLIDFSDEAEETATDPSAAPAQLRKPAANRSVSAADVSARKAPPPRPAKPAALRSSPSIGELRAKPREASSAGERPPPPPPRRSGGQAADRSGAHPLSQMQTPSRNGKPPAVEKSGGSAPPPPLPRRPDNGPKRAQTFGDLELLPPPGRSSGSGTPSDSPNLGPQTVNKKLELWRRRLARAHEELDKRGIQLYTWRRGSDVIAEAEGIVQQALGRLEQKRKSPGQLEREFRRDLGQR